MKATVWGPGAKHLGEVTLRGKASEDAIGNAMLARKALQHLDVDVDDVAHVMLSGDSRADVPQEHLRLDWVRAAIDAENREFDAFMRKELRPFLDVLGGI